MIQIDMQMPANCLDCPACNEYLACAIPVNGRGWGENDVREFSQGRPEWCPMKEQEAKPIKYKENWMTGLPIAICPKCGRFAQQFHMPQPGEETHFCPWCGQEVKWNG